MYYWRVTKYDPKNRNERGHYQKDEWISVGDIGTVYDGVEFTFDAYLLAENAYVDAIIRIMRGNNTESLTVKRLQKNHRYVNYADFPEIELRKYVRELKTNTIMPMHDIMKIARLVLRERIWCKLESEHMFVHFGDDYYMFIGSENELKNEISAIRENGLFVEDMVSPYLY